MKISKELFKNHRFPAEILQYAVWLYFVFPLNFRDVELLLHQRGLGVSHEAVRAWCYNFGPYFAQRIRQKRRSATDKWHLDEVFLTIGGQRYYLWRSADSEGMILDIMMQTRHNAKVAKRFFEGVLDTTATRPRVIVTDGLRSYNITFRVLLPGVEHRRSKYLINRAENSHQPTRRCERRMQHFKSMQQAQLFLSFFDFFYHYFHPKKHKLQADEYRDQLDFRYDTWLQLVA